VQDHAGGNGDQQVVIVRPHPAIAPRRGAQSVASVVVHDMTHAGIAVPASPVVATTVVPAPGATPILAVMAAVSVVAALVVCVVPVPAAVPASVALRCGHRHPGKRTKSEYQPEFEKPAAHRYLRHTSASRRRIRT